MHAHLQERPRYTESGEIPAWASATAAGAASEELTWLAAVASDIQVAARVWIPPSVEASFYQLNQLGPQLGALFGREANPDPDEDEIEDLVPDAQELLASHALDDLIIEAFFEACESLPSRLQVRHLGTDPTTPAITALRGRPALLALRSLWKRDWELDAVVARLRQGDGLMPRARIAVLHAVDAPANPAIARQATTLIGVDGIQVMAAQGRVTRVLRPETTS